MQTWEAIDTWVRFKAVGVEAKNKRESLDREGGSGLGHTNI